MILVARLLLLTSILFLPIATVKGQKPINHGIVSDIQFSKSRFSSAPVYLTKDPYSYWFAFQNGKKDATLLKLNKDLHGGLQLKFPYIPERDQIKSGRISENEIQVDLLKNNRTNYLYFRYRSDTLLTELQCDTLFQIEKQFPLQKIRMDSHEAGDTLIVWAIRELRGFDEEQLLFIFYSYSGKLTTDTISLFRGYAHLIDVVGSEWNRGNIRLFIRKYEHRAVEKRAFQVNYTYGWADVALNERKNTQLLLIERDTRYLSGPCFDDYDNGTIFISGLYGTHAKHKVTGYFHYLDTLTSANKDSILLEPNFHEFNASFWADHKKRQRWSTQIKRNRLDDFFIERYFNNKASEHVFQIQQMYVTDGGSFSRPQLYYHFKDHIIYATDSLGILKWFSRIPCNQVLYEPFERFGGSSFFQEDNILHVLFQNEHPKNKLQVTLSRKMRSMTRPQNGVLRVYVLENGVLKGKETIMLPNQKRAYALASDVLKIHNGKYLVFYESNHSLVPAYIEWKKS